MNVGKIRKHLHRAERLFGMIDKSHHGHHRGHKRRRRSGAGEEVLRQLLRRIK